MDLTKLHRLASRLGFCTAEALVMFSELRPLLQSAHELDQLSAQHDHNSSFDHRFRNWWRPSPDSNLHNAWFVRCSITASKSDPNQTNERQARGREGHDSGGGPPALCRLAPPLRLRASRRRASGRPAAGGERHTARENELRGARRVVLEPHLRLRPCAELGAGATGLEVTPVSDSRIDVCEWV